MLTSVVVSIFFVIVLVVVFVGAGLGTREEACCRSKNATSNDEGQWIFVAEIEKLAMIALNTLIMAKTEGHSSLDALK